MSQTPRNSVGLSVIIPHLRGKETLTRCLDALAADPVNPWQVIVVDNGSTDNSVEAAAKKHPWATVVRSRTNLGFAGGCNLGLEHAERPYVLILNDDAEVAPGCLRALLEFAEAHPEYAALQPKIRSLKRPDVFDYAGAAGGFIDRFGYPFARGRVFSDMEADHGQYDDDCDVHWASGACCLLRREALSGVGVFDGRFFSHMEEIDLCWRFWLAGWKVGFVADALVLHRGASTLAEGDPQKAFLNHRNSLWMIAKNLSLGALFVSLPTRILLDWAAVFFHLFHLRPRTAVAVVAAQLAAVAGVGHVGATRHQVQRVRRVTDDQLRRVISRRSVVIQNMLLGRRKFSELEGIAPQGEGRRR